MKPLHVLLGTLGAVAVVAVLSIVRPEAVGHLDRGAYDELLRRADLPPLTNRVSIVAVDEKSIAEIGQWPWGRDVLARLVERLRDLGAGVIAFDVILSEPDRLGEHQTHATNPGHANTTTTDATLAEALGHQHVVTSYAFTFDAPDRYTPGCVLHPLHTVLVQSAGQPSPAHRLFQPNGVLCSLTVFNRAAGASGFLNVGHDSDGVVRRVPVLMEYRGELFPSLALAAVQQIRGTRLVTMRATSDRLTLDVAGQTIPLDPQGRLLLRFRGLGRTIRYVSASDVLDGQLPAGSFADQIVFVGGTAVGVSDEVPTPVDPSYPGLEVHATVAESLLGRDVLALPWYRWPDDLGTAVA